MSAIATVDTRLALYLVEPSLSVSEALATLLEDRVRSSVRFASAEALLQSRLVLEPNRCLITELHLPGMNGIELMLALDREHRSTPTLVTSSAANRRAAARAARLGAIDFIEKPLVSARVLAGLGRIEAGDEAWSWRA